MNIEEIQQQIEIKFGEVLEMVPPNEKSKMYIRILLHMLAETKNDNEYLKKRLDACQR